MSSEKLAAELFICLCYIAFSILGVAAGLWIILKLMTFCGLASIAFSWGLVLKVYIVLLIFMNLFKVWYKLF